MKRRSNNGYGETKERQAYQDRHHIKPLPIIGDVIQIGRFKGANVERIRKIHPEYYRWACENVQDFQFLAEQAMDRSIDFKPLNRRKSRDT
jgi:hypothetical protein